METQVKRYEKQCLDYAERYKRNWEYYTLVKDAWLAGYNKAKENFTQFESEKENLILPPGGHQIGDGLVRNGE